MATPPVGGSLLSKQFVLPGIQQLSACLSMVPKVSKHADGDYFWTSGGIAPYNQQPPAAHVGNGAHSSAEWPVSPHLPLVKWGDALHVPVEVHAAQPVKNKVTPQVSLLHYRETGHHGEQPGSQLKYIRHHAGIVDHPAAGRGAAAAPTSCQSCSRGVPEVHELGPKSGLWAHSPALECTAELSYGAVAWIGHGSCSPLSCQRRLLPYMSAVMLPSLCAGRWGGCLLPRCN